MSNQDFDDLRHLIRTLQEQQDNQDSLEQMLLQLILNPVSAQRQIIRVDDDLEDGILFELREATIINEHGIQEERQELVVNPVCLGDGSAMNIYGVVRCSACGSLVMQDSIRVCQFCGRMCCISRGCGRYSKLRDKWYCSRKHRAMGLLGVNIR